MKIGKLRHRVTIQTATETRDNFGQTVRTWADTETRYASVEPLQGRELERAKQMTNEVTHKITLRYFDGLTTQHRITFDTRVFNISQVLNTAERNLETVVLALEEVT